MNSKQGVIKKKKKKSQANVNSWPQTDFRNKWVLCGVSSCMTFIRNYFGREWLRKVFYPLYIAITIILPAWLFIATLTYADTEKLQPVTTYYSGTQTNELKGKSIVGINGDAKKKIWVKALTYYTSCHPSFKNVLLLTGLKSVMNFISPG